MNKKIIFFEILSVVGFLAAFSTNSFGFIFGRNDLFSSYLKGNRSIAHAPKWPNSTVTFHLNTNLAALGGGAFPASFSGATFQANVNLAIAAWNNINCKTGLTVLLGGTTTNTFSTGDNVNVIAYDDRLAAAGLCNSSAALGCSLPAPSFDQFGDCDISINGASNVSWGTGGSQYDMVSVLVHEIGHCMGLDHTVEPPTYTSSNTFLLNAVMYPALSNGVTKRTLTQDERDAMQCIASSASDTVRNPCLSYHGTNGGAAITGAITGGPSQDYTPSCSSSSSQASSSAQDSSNNAVVSGVQKSNDTGCISKSFASGKSESKSTASKSLFAYLTDFFLWAGSWLCCWLMALAPLKAIRKFHRWALLK